ncbi:MAG: hypothetical protein FVQ81_18635, partial [Candidatus Glassbacteria bacterium]|nr:hypothetical protein [Candidatus Glassbacteria bacterium]
MIASSIRSRREPSSVMGTIWSCTKLLKSAFFLLAGLLLLIFYQPVWADYADGGENPRPLRVMTQNLYVGSDILQIMQATDTMEFFWWVRNVYWEMVDTNFHERAAAIADQIAAKSPDLIGLQEVALVRTQSPGDFFGNDPQPAEYVEFDFLDLLMGELTARGLDYRVAAEVENADVELPMLPIDEGSPYLADARVTFRDVILAAGGVTIGSAFEENYQVNLPVVVMGISIEFTRGYTIVDATVRDRSYRFANTHLESVKEGDAAAVQVAQAGELLVALSEIEAQFGALPTIIVGDLNSSPEDVAPAPGLTPPYHLISAYQFEDAWLFRKEGPAPGLTCCQAADLRNAESQLNERIDHIFVRTPGGLADTTV